MNRIKPFFWHSKPTKEEKLIEEAHDIANLVSMLANMANLSILEWQLQDERPNGYDYEQIEITLLGIRRMADLLAFKASNSWERKQQL